MRLFMLIGLLISSVALAAEPSDITHSFLATGAETYIVAANGKVVWEFPRSTRDGWILPNGHALLALSKSKDFPGGGVAEVEIPSGKILWSFAGTQSEVNTVQDIGDGRFMLTEAGPKPRILEIDRTGKVLLEIPIQAQTANIHLQSRMTRKLKNGHYLVPQLTDKVVREYDSAGQIVWEVKTPDMPFTAIRLDNGNTLINCTHGNLSIEVDAAGKTVWQITNDDLKAKLISDACGAQRLPNGNTVICSYHIGPGGLKLLEVTPDKKLVWTFFGEKAKGIHEVHILDTNGTNITEPLR
jgi:outer membrane protein assembly factor BamB